jgi:hypothetical protein
MSAGKFPFCRMTRRQWTFWLSLTPLAAQVTSTAPPTGLPAPGPSTATPEQKLQKAYGDIRQISEQLSKIEVPMNVEPAFSFRA